MNLAKWIARGAWVIAALACLWLWQRTNARRGAMVGVAHLVEYSVAPETPRRVLQVLVKPGQDVAVGALLVALDSSGLTAQRAEAEAELEVLAAELTALAQSTRRGLDVRRSELRLAAAEARTASLGARADRQGREAELKALETRLKRLSALGEAALVRSDRLSEVRTRRARLKGERRQGRAVIEAYQALAETLSEVAEAAGQLDVEIPLAPLKARMALQKTRLKGLDAALARCRLVAPIAGRVMRVERQPGDVAGPSAPVVVLGVVKTQKVVAYAEEKHARVWAVGEDVRVFSSGGKAGLEGKIVSLGAGVVKLPQRFWHDPRKPRFGREVWVEVKGALLPGEMVEVRP